MTRQRVALTGASGLIGGALSASLRADGHEVRTFVRRPARTADERSWDPAAGRLDPADLAGIDVVVNLSGAGVADRRWSPARKREILRSRVDATRTIVCALAEGAGPRHLINASAVGYYGERRDEVLAEGSAPGSGFLAEVVRAWEAAAGPASQAGIAVALARTGIVLSPDGGALAPMLRVGRLGLGGPLGSGRQWMPWISMPDEVRALRHLIDHPEVTGPVNLCVPRPTRQVDLARALGRHLGRPAVLPAPTPALRLVLGEAAGEILASTRVVPERLRTTGFEWEHPDLGAAFDALL